VRLLWRLVQAEQVCRRPAERFGLLAPLGKEALAILDTLPPALDRDQGRRLELEVSECPPVSLRLRQLDDLDLGADAIRSGRRRAIGRSRLSELRLR